MYFVNSRDQRLQMQKPGFGCDRIFFSLVPPRWIVEPADQSVVLGKSVVLQCQADGFPKPTVTWKQAIGESIFFSLYAPL
jgi:hypothetical protein